MVKNVRTTTLVGAKCYIDWVPSGGAGSPASESRLDMLVATLRLHKRDGVPVVVVFSGETTRLGHDLDQAQLLADAFPKEEFDWVTVRVIPSGLEDTYRILVAEYQGAEYVKLFCELPYMWLFLERLAIVDAEYRKRIKPVTYDIYEHAAYIREHSPNDIAARGAAMAFQSAVKRMGLFQVLLKWVYLKVGKKSSKNPLKNGFVRLVTKMLREDLRK